MKNSKEITAIIDEIGRIEMRVTIASIVLAVIVITGLVITF